MKKKPQQRGIGRTRKPALERTRTTASHGEVRIVEATVQASGRKPTRKPTFHFTVFVDAPEIDIDMSNLLFEAGCDDSTPGSSCGQAHIEFHRTAASLKDAVMSAIADVQKTGLHVEKVTTQESMTIEAINLDLERIGA